MYTFITSSTPFFSVSRGFILRLSIKIEKKEGSRRGFGGVGWGVIKLDSGQGWFQWRLHIN